MDKNFLGNFREVLRLFDRELFFQNVSSCCGGVTLAQCHTLLEIENNDKITVTELSGNLLLDKSTTSRTVDSLVKSGFVKRSIPSNNRRITSLYLTEAGKKTCQDINWNNEKYLEDSLSQLSDIEKKELLRLFDKITNNMINIRKNSSENYDSAC
jgi:DNA-binding MarR family transcriptional regulator